MSVTDKSKNGFRQLIRDMDYHPISEKQIVGFTKKELEQDFYFGQTVPDDLEVIKLLADRKKGKGNIFIRSRKRVFELDIKEGLQNLNIDAIIIKSEKELPMNIIPVLNPPISVRNADGKGRVDIYQDLVKNADSLRNGSTLPGSAILTNGWWTNDEKEFQQWLLPQVYKMVFTPGKEYDVLQDLWATFWKPGYNGPIQVVNEIEGYNYQYDFKKLGAIIDAKDPALIDLIVNTQTAKKYIYEQGKQDSATTIKKHKNNLTINYLETVKLRNDDKKLITYGKYTVVKGSSDILDISKERHFNSWKLVKQYQGEDSSSNIFKDNPNDWKRHKLVVVPPKISIPNGYAYLPFDTEDEAKRHYHHIMGPLVNFQNDLTRVGKSISRIQTKFLTHLDELPKLNKEQQKLLKQYHDKFRSEEYC